MTVIDSLFRKQTLEEFLSQFPDIKEEDNPIVFCERCKKEHRYWTATRDDVKKMFERGIDTHDDEEIERRIFNDSLSNST